MVFEFNIENFYRNLNLILLEVIIMLVMPNIF